jgi:hypothetical protein
MLSLETETYYMSHGECALQSFSSNNSLTSSIQDVLSEKPFYYLARNGSLATIRCVWPFYFIPVGQLLDIHRGLRLNNVLPSCLHHLDVPVHGTGLQCRHSTTSISNYSCFLMIVPRRSTPLVYGMQSFIVCWAEKQFMECMLRIEQKIQVARKRKPVAEGGISVGGPRRCAVGKKR